MSLKNFSYLERSVTEKEGEEETQKEKSYLLVQLTDGHHTQSWARPE